MRVSAAIDTAIAAIAPLWGLRRRQARAAMKAYEATEINRTRRRVARDNRSGDAVVRSAGTSLRAQARHLERNHDIARGAIGVMVNNICGPQGVGIEPQPRTLAGEIHEGLAGAMLELWRDWSRRPEVTWANDWAATQRLMCRSWVRDGEVLAQVLEGRVPMLDHGTRVPLSLEMLEADLLPLDLEDEARGIRQGVEVNAWRRARAYHLYKSHPGDRVTLARGAQFKRVAAERVLHLKLTDRIHQLRGVSPFAAIITRLDDIKDYEESERVAAKVAASMAAMIVKGTPDFYDPDKTADPREIKFTPGMVFDDLMPGETVEVIDSKRPNPNVETYRNGQLRAAAAGLGVSYSSMAKHYDGTYSAQRQELVEQWVHYAVVTQAFTAQFVRPVWERFVGAAITAGQLDIPADLDPQTLDDALYIGQAMPWIDPKKEAEALEKQEQAGYMSGPEIIRRRGANPREVLEQEAAWRKRLRDRGVVVTADPANDIPAAAAPAAIDPMDNA
jgi:lambda family phage portal protein